MKTSMIINLTNDAMSPKTYHTMENRKNVLLPVFDLIGASC